MLDLGGGNRILLPRRGKAPRDIAIRRAADGGIEVSDPAAGRLHLAPGNGVSTLETPEGRYTIDNEVLRELNGGRDLWDDIRSRGLETGFEPSEASPGAAPAQSQQTADGTTVVTLPDGRTVVVTPDGNAQVIPRKSRGCRRGRARSRRGSGRGRANETFHAPHPIPPAVSACTTSYRGDEGSRLDLRRHLGKAPDGRHPGMAGMPARFVPPGAPSPALGARGASRSGRGGLP